MNKILYPTLIVFAIYIPIIGYALYEHSAESLFASGIGTIFVLLVAWKSKDNFWINRRLPAMTPNHYKTANVNIDSIEKNVNVWDEDSCIRFALDLKDNKFRISRIMLMNPKRSSKEYEERKYQFHTRMEQSLIPYNELMISLYDSIFSFKVIVEFDRKKATIDNIRTVRSIMMDLGKDDFNQHLFVRVTYENQIVLLDTYQYNLIRAMLLVNESVVEKYSSIKTVDVSTTKSDTLVPLLEKYFEKNKLAKISIDDIIEEKDFEELWNKEEKD